MKKHTQTGGINQSALYGCTSCYEYCTFPADHLSVHENECWCADCWDNGDMERETGIEYSDLPEFVPDAGWQPIETAPVVEQEPVAWQPVDELRFEYRHPKTGESYTVSLSREEVAEQMDQELFEKLTACFCECGPIGETYAFDCSCEERAVQFELVPASPLPTPDVAALVDAASMALSAIGEVLNEAYHGAGVVCCGRHSGGECCGSPEPEWSETDQAAMDRFGPIHRALETALAAYRNRGE